MPDEVYGHPERQSVISTREMAERLINSLVASPEAIQEDSELLEGDDILNLVNSRVIYDPREIFPRLLPEIKSQIENGPYAQYYDVIYVDAALLKPDGLREEQEITNLLPKAILKAAGEDVGTSAELPIDRLDDYIKAKTQEKRCVVILVDHLDALLDQLDDRYDQYLATNCFKHSSRPPYLIKMAKHPSSRRYPEEVLANFNEFGIEGLSVTFSAESGCVQITPLLREIGWDEDMQSELEFFAHVESFTEDRADLQKRLLDTLLICNSISYATDDPIWHRSAEKLKREVVDHLRWLSTDEKDIEAWSDQVLKEEDFVRLKEVIQRAV